MAAQTGKTQNDTSIKPVSSYWECSACHAYNQSTRKSCKACSLLRQDLLSDLLNVKDGKIKQESINNTSASTNMNLLAAAPPTTPTPTVNNTCTIPKGVERSISSTRTEHPLKWYCVICAKYNENGEQSCGECGEIYMTNQDYMNFVIEQGKQLTRYSEDSAAFRDDLRLLTESAYYKNNEEFDCIICCETIGKEKGVLFHHCLHPLCKRCVIRSIETSDSPLIKCPHDDCQEYITERELRGIATDMRRDQKIVDRLQEIGIRWAESRHKTFHCITPNCAYWWFIEQQIQNIVYCEGCSSWICMTCNARHDGQSCAQYQDDLKIRAVNDVNARKDKEHLEEMIRKGEAMHCPGCKVIVQKLSGCDWLQCTMCKMEICWPTRKISSVMLILRIRQLILILE
ncbi:unnamed protein product [Didymodactylos carnosus]|uniref:RanBP-type and C3HC4-type zinc finger-containing protein 1 n=1 Tax=Didymodactylos carnosus TaxID=1234261 RepID=A0A8S2DGE7_9BILA|nr:unnamed protein product [Didymodactylos carnosus]CAF3727494.1 unnamed protein product [Didymodactylos carnosus]